MKEIITNKDIMEMCYLTRNPLYSKKKVRLLQKELTWEIVQVLNLSRTGRRLILQPLTFITSSWFLHFTCNMIHSFVLHCIKWIFVVLETLILEVSDSLFLCHIVILLKKKKEIYSFYKEFLSYTLFGIQIFVLLSWDQILLPLFSQNCHRFQQSLA